VKIVRTVAKKSLNRLKFCWLKVICCICQSNELEREIKHKTGGPSRVQPKICGGHGPARPWSYSEVLLIFRDRWKNLRTVSVSQNIFKNTAGKIRDVGLHCNESDVV